MTPRRRGYALLGCLFALVTATSACESRVLPGAQDVAPSSVDSASPSVAPSATGTGPTAGASPTPRASRTPGSPVLAGIPQSGPGTFRYLNTAGPVLGHGGAVRHFHVAVESNLATVDPSSVAATIDEALGDSRSWIASGRVRLQRVASGVPAQFTIYLVTARTTRAMCARGGVTGTMGYTSCRYSGHVVLNLDRWLTSVPYYAKAGLPLSVYRAYMVNHEVGHELGHGHELCPGRGRPAPVMEQQTLGLHGCTPNPWPYLAGSRYTGPPGSY